MVKEATTRNYLLSLIRKDFDLARNNNQYEVAICAAIEVAGKEDERTKEMIADFEFENILNSK